MLRNGINQILFLNFKYLAFMMTLICIVDNNQKLLPHFICLCNPCPNSYVTAEILPHEN